MKKNKLSVVLLLITTGCFASVSVVAVAATHTSHKKNKIAQKRRMTEKDISECTRLINKVARTDKMLQNEMIANNSKIAEHLKKPADVQLFASDDPAAIAHLTGRTTANLPTPPAVRQTVKAMPVPAKPITQLAPSPVFKPTTATLVATTSTAVKPVVPPSSKYGIKPPSNTQIFVPDNFHLTGKTAKQLNNSIPKYNTIKSTTKPAVVKSAPVKPTPPLQSHPHIELSAPNSAVDLNHLEGKSANLADFKKSATANKSVQKKTKKSTHKAKKPAPAW